MKITILYGNPVQDDTEFSDYIKTLAEEFRKEHSVDLYLLHTMNLRYFRPWPSRFVKQMSENVSVAHTC